LDMLKRRGFHPSGHLTKRGSRVPSRGWLYREGCKTCYDSAHLSLQLNSAQLRSDRTHCHTRPSLRPPWPGPGPVSRGGRGSSRPDAPTTPFLPLPLPLPTRSIPFRRSFPSMDKPRAPLPPLSPSSLEQGTPPLGSCGTNLRCSTPHTFSPAHPHTRLPGPGRIEEGQPCVGMHYDADAIRILVSQKSFSLPRLPFLRFLPARTYQPVPFLFLCRVRVNVHPHPKAQVLHV
jgi:hypothetical protein